WASAQQVDTLIVGWLADPASAGMYHIAKRIGRVVLQVGSHIQAVVYPDLTRQWASGDRTDFVKLIQQTELILMAFGATCFVAAWSLGGLALRLTAGPAFAAAAPLLTIQIIAVSLTVSGAASRAGLLAMDRQPAVLRTVLAAAATFYCMVGPLVTLFGAMGANLAHILFGLVWLGGLTIALRSGLRTSAASSKTAEPGAEQA
ncbi:MAG: lipopolysaccharide biosynthesis protein, partial [Sphingomonadales bacterium]